MCDHSVVIEGMCALCGEDLHAKEKSSAVCAVSKTLPRLAPKRSYASSSASIAVVANIPGLVVSKERAEQMGKEHITKLLERRQLVLLVDLDQTLVHTTNERIPADMKDVHHFQLVNGPYMVWYHTKLRPGTRDFLTEISNKFELQIATFGSRMYAHKVAEFLDPEKKVFHPSRILSRDECFSPLTKTANMENLFPCGDSLVCIIDDRDEVWNFAKNLVRVRPYFFFANTGDINAPGGIGENKEIERRAEISIGHDIKRRKLDEPEPIDVEDTDNYLLYLPDILNKIHSAFFEQYDKHLADTDGVTMPDVKKIVPALKAKTLVGCRIVFSGVIPKNTPVGLSRPYIVAKELGGLIQDDITSEPEDQYTTHLIAAYWNTAKVKAAQDLGCHIVTIGWLWCCSERWNRADETVFLLPKDADSNSAVREDERVSTSRSKKNAKDELPSSSNDPETGQLSTLDDVGTATPIVLTNDLIREMNDEVIKALEEDGLSLSSGSSDEEEGADKTRIGAKNPRKRVDDDSSSEESTTPRCDVDEDSSFDET